MFPHNAHFCEAVHAVSGIVPVNLATGANAGDWVSLKNYAGCAVVFFAGAGTAGEDPTLTVLQATNVAGSGTTKGVNFTRVDVKQATALTSVGTFTTVTQAAANTYTDDDAAEAQKIWVVDIKADMLDADGGYDCIQASIGDVGSQSQIGCVLYLLYGPRYGSGTLPSAIAD